VNILMSARLSVSMVMELSLVLAILIENGLLDLGFCLVTVIVLISSGFMLKMCVS
jgi:hypothetical protein